MRPTRQHDGQAIKQVRLLDRLGQIGRRSPTCPAALRVVRAPQRASAAPCVVAARRRSAWMAPAEASPSIPGICRSMHAQSKGIALVVRPGREPRARRGRLRPRPGACPRRPACAGRISRLVALSSTISTRMSVQRVSGRRPAFGGAAGRLAEARGEPELRSRARVRCATPICAAHQLGQLLARWPGPGRCRRTCAWWRRRPG